MKKTYFLLGVLIFVIIFGFLLNRKVSSNGEKIIFETPSARSLMPSVSPKDEPSPVVSSIPSKHLISGFAFQSQAPLGNWDTLHEEACEEASLILVKYWLDGKDLTAQQMENEIQAMIAWEDANGYPKDLTASQEAKLAKAYYQISNVRSDPDINIEKIKTEIANNHPVIIPAAGRLLGNPYFTSPGPVYHMVVVIGYDQNNIIVQDVGTRRGDHYTYNKEIFFNAIHEWTGSPDTIEQGAKTAIIF